MLALVDTPMLFSDILLPLVAATVLGGAIGLEREFHGRPAGLRTHIIVCLGSTMIMLISMQLYHLFPTIGITARPDPSRIAAGIVTGIGFIGAGAIMKLKSSNRGLTTAACIWFAASLGIVVGVGAYTLAVVGTVFALGVLMLLAAFEHHLGVATYRELIVVAARAEDLLARIMTAVTELGITVQSHEFEEEIEKNQIRAIFNVRYRRGSVSEDVLLRHLRAIPGVRTIGWRTTAT